MLTRLQCHLDALFQYANDVVVIGWLATPGTASLHVSHGNSHASSLWFKRLPRHDVASYLGIGAIDTQGLGFIALVPNWEKLQRQAQLTVAVVTDRRRRKLSAFVEPQLSSHLRSRLGAIATEAAKVCPDPRLSAYLRASETASNRSDRSKLLDRFAVDHCLRIDDSSVFVSGWAARVQGERLSLEVLDHDGTKLADLTRNRIAVSRPDVVESFKNVLRVQQNCGFAARVPVSPSTGAFRLRLSDNDGQVVERTVSIQQSSSPQKLLNLAVSSFSADTMMDLPTFGSHIAPLFAAYEQKRLRKEPEPRQWSFGTPPKKPLISIVVPLYGRCDFLRYQLACFANDPTFQDVDLIYVVDDPDLVSETVHLASQSHCVFQRPFRVLSSGENLGFAGANNFAVQFARADTLLLLNSDVVPGAPGWLETMLRASSSGVGVVGAQLLYEDGALQHAGMRLMPFPRWGGLQIVTHPGKGLPPSPRPQSVSEVEAVTGACLLVSRDLYLQLGGLDEGYLFGDFEDYQFCLHVRRSGLKVVCVHDVTLYHLERQSFARLGRESWRSKVTYYNCWRLNQGLAQSQGG